jgi:hypothetical protein
MFSPKNQEIKSEPPKGRVKINVGGTEFETMIETLMGRSGYFKNLFNNDFKNGSVVFVDRSPKIFEHILNLLRDPEYTYPFKYVSELKFYGIDHKPRNECELFGVHIPAEHLGSILIDVCILIASSKFKIGICGKSGCIGASTDGGFCVGHCIKEDKS